MNEPLHLWKSTVTHKRRGCDHCTKCVYVVSESDSAQDVSREIINTHSDVTKIWSIEHISRTSVVGWSVG